MSDADVIVIGGGLHGCSAAYNLARQHVRVLVLEKHVVGRHASSASAGGVRRLGRHPAEIPLAVASIELWHRLNDMLGHDTEFHATGQVRVAESDADMRACEERVALARSLGYDHEILIDRAELRRLVPGINDEAVGGIHVERDGHAFPYKTTAAFRCAAEQHGADVREGVRVLGIERLTGAWRVETDRGRFEAPVLVNAAGAWGGEVAAMIGDPVPLEPVALMMMVTARMPQWLGPTVGCMSRKLSFKQSESGTMVIGGGHRGTVHPDTELTTLNFSHLSVSARTVAEVFPHMRDVAIVRCWAGIEGFTPDDIPFIGPSKAAPDAYHSFGFCGHGFQLGPVVGSITAELIVNGRTNLPIEPFRIDRFAGAAQG